MLYQGCIRYVQGYINAAQPGQEYQNETVRMWVEEGLQRGILREWHKARRRTIQVEIQFVSRYVVTLAAVSRTWMGIVRQISEGQYLFLDDGETMPGHGSHCAPS